MVTGAGPDLPARLGAGLSGRRVLVTGHTGFKGAWLTVWLRRLGAEVSGLSLDPPSSPSLFDVLGLGAGMVSHRGDIRDLATVRDVLDASRPDVVFHLAAQPLVRHSFAHPVPTFDTNVMGTVNVLEACRLAGCVQAVVNVTSDKCYENREWVWGYRENDAMGGYDPYSASKGCAELVNASYRRSFFQADGPALASARAGNVIGGGDWGGDRLVPDCIRALSTGRPIVIRRPKAMRPWQHVLEPLSGYLLLAGRLLERDAAGRLTREFADGWNFGPKGNDALSVGEVASLVVECWGGGAITLDPGPHPHEAHYLKLDCSKAAMTLDWTARWSPRQAVRRTVDWYQRFHSGDTPEALLELMHRQIDEYAAGSC